MRTMAETNTREQHEERRKEREGEARQGELRSRGTKQEFHLKNNEFSGKGACKTTFS